MHSLVVIIRRNITLGLNLGSFGRTAHHNIVLHKFANRFVLLPHNSNHSSPFSEHLILDRILYSVKLWLKIPWQNDLLESVHNFIALLGLMVIVGIVK